MQGSMDLFTSRWADPGFTQWSPSLFPHLPVPVMWPYASVLHVHGLTSPWDLTLGCLWAWTGQEERQHLPQYIVWLHTDAGKNGTFCSLFFWHLYFEKIPSHLNIRSWNSACISFALHFIPLSKFLHWNPCQLYPNSQQHTDEVSQVQS